MRFQSILPIAATILVGVDTAHQTAAFYSPIVPLCQHRQRLLATSNSNRGFSSPRLAQLRARKGDIEDEDDADRALDALSARKLGINIGAELPKITQEEIDEIRVRVQSTLDEKIDGRLAEIDELRAQLEQDAIESKQRMKNASELNAQYEKQNLMEKIDRLSEDFLSANAEFRESTKRAAAADKLTGSEGKGLDWGSWGSVGGLDVILGTSESDRPSSLLGSVDSARRRSELEAEFEGGETFSVNVENRVLAVFDENRVSAIFLTALLDSSLAIFLRINV